jgi:hypothetical protein
VNQGYDPARAISEVRFKRPQSIERKAQEDAVYAYARLVARPQ